MGQASPRKYFGTDGIRGQVGQGCVTPEFVLKLGWAAGRVLGRGPGSRILIGKDTRISGYLFESALEAGLAAAGVDIQLLGPMPTPAIAYLTRVLGATAGIVISASHNPHGDNGIKFFGATGEKLLDEVELLIERELDQPLTLVEPHLLGKARRVDDAASRYVRFCKDSLPSGLTLAGLRIVVDCAHGACYQVTPRALAELGAEVTRLGCEPDGLNINAGVGSTHPEALQAQVRELGADLGVALDGDGDRLILVDGQGNLVDGDGILYLIARARRRDGTLTGPVVGTLMSNLGLEQALRAQGIGFERTAVGDRYVLERLKAEGGILGGEPSGHIICRDRTSTGDGTIAALQVLAEMVHTGSDLAGLVAGLEIFPQVLVNVRLESPGNPLASQPVRDALAAAEAELDGQGRILLRPSGTEPLARVMVEGRDLDQVRRIAGQLADAVRAGLAG
jgi:phosphoglucosamine mutase